MPINLTAAGAAGVHSFRRVSANTEENYIYFKDSNMPASFVTGASFIYASSTGSLTFTGGDGTLVVADRVNSKLLKFKTPGDLEADLTGSTEGNISLNLPSCL
jgi:hypothetical protein